jgi:hypothetical protein
VLARPTSIGLDIPSGFPKPILKAATADQIGRILGDWLRMQGNSFRSIDPEMGNESYFYAGRMLERAYRDDNGLPPDVDPSGSGEHSADAPRNPALGSAVVMKPFVISAQRIHDPRLLAVYGLYERDPGDDAKAREFLEAAVTAGVVRPAAYDALAKLRLAEAIARPMGQDGKLSVAQAASVLGLLEAALRVAPSYDAYDMMVGTWTNCEAKPAEGDMAEISKGVALYPRMTDLAYNSALLGLQSGYAVQASKLIDQGLVFATNEVKREYLEQLRSTLSAPSPSDSAKTEGQHTPK